jgi:hypothetical protein
LTADTQVSSLLEKGAVAVVNANTKVGRYLVRLERDLLAKMKNPSQDRRLMLSGYVRRQYQLEQFEQRLFKLAVPTNEDLSLYARLHTQQMRVHKALFGGIPDDDALAADILSLVQRKAARNARLVVPDPEQPARPALAEIAAEMVQ